MNILTDEQLAPIEKAESLRLPWEQYAQWAFYEEFIDPPDERGMRSNSFCERMWILAVRVKFRCPDWSARRAWLRVCRIGAQIDAEGHYGFTADADDEACFYRAWEKCRRPTLGDLLIDALALAERHPMTWPTTHASPQGAYDRFKSFVAFLAALVDSDTVALPVKRIGEVLGHRPNTICQWRDWGEDENWLELASEYNKGGHKARRYMVAPEVVQAAVMALGGPLTKSGTVNYEHRNIRTEETRSPTTASADGSDADTERCNSALGNSSISETAAPEKAQPTDSATESKAPRTRARATPADEDVDEYLDVDPQYRAWIKSKLG